MDRDEMAEVVESQTTISGMHICGLEHSIGPLKEHSILASSNGLKWTIINEEHLSFVKHGIDASILKKIEEGFIRFYVIKPVGHDQKPKVGEKVKIIRNTLAQTK